MKNVTTRYFCRKFSATFTAEDKKFMLRYKRMRECYDALLNGGEENFSGDFAVYILTQDGVADDHIIRSFTLQCLSLIKDQIILCMNYTNIVPQVTECCRWAVEWACCHNAGMGARNVFTNVEDLGYGKQLEVILKEFGNPF